MKKTRNNFGFTLIEVLVVVIIIGLLAGIAVIRVGSTKDIAIINSTASNIKTISSIRNSLVGIDNSSIEENIRPETNFTLSLNDDTGVLEFAYIGTVPGLVDVEGTNTAISNIINASVVHPREMFRTIQSAIDNNLVNGSGYLEYNGIVQHPFIRFQGVGPGDSFRIRYADPGVWWIESDN